MNSRRTLVRLGILALAVTVALAATVVLTGAPPVTAEGSAVAPEIEGTWLGTITIPDGPPPFPSLLTYARGGGLTVTDSSVAPNLGNVYQGSWSKTGPREFTFTALGFQYDDDGVFAGYIKLHEVLTLTPDGKAYDGDSTIEILDPAQNVIAEGSSKSHAVRVSAK